VLVLVVVVVVVVVVFVVFVVCCGGVVFHFQGKRPSHDIPSVSTAVAAVLIHIS
jgi:hypothetical protein